MCTCVSTYTHTLHTHTYVEKKKNHKCCFHSVSFSLHCVSAPKEYGEGGAIFSTAMSMLGSRRQKQHGPELTHKICSLLREVGIPSVLGQKSFL